MSAVRPLDLTRPSLRCRCGKTYGMTEADARGMAEAIQKHNGKRERLRFYQCQHNGWHWTRRKQWLTRISCSCGEVFLPQHPGAKYCSTACKRRAAKARKRERTNTCHNPECGKRFLYKPHSPGQKYCSDACRERNNMLKFAAKLAARKAAAQ